MVLFFIFLTIRLELFNDDTIVKKSSFFEQKFLLQKIQVFNLSKNFIQEFFYLRITISECVKRNFLRKYKKIFANTKYNALLN